MRISLASVIGQMLDSPGRSAVQLSKGLALVYYGDEAGRVFLIGRNGVSPSLSEVDTVSAVLLSVWGSGSFEVVLTVMEDGWNVFSIRWAAQGVLGLDGDGLDVSGSGAFDVD